MPPWKILLVDDEQDVHTVTQMALKRFTLDERKVEFLHAYSAKEAKGVLQQEQDIALVFLDVVMETDNAGLELARWMRQDLKNHFARIVLRTGQAGQAPEEKVIVEYDINDYKEKTELNRTKLFTTVFSALRAYRDIIKIEEARKYQELYRTGLERVITATSNILEKQTLKQFFSDLLRQIMRLLQTEDEHILHDSKLIGASFTGEKYEVITQINCCESEEEVIVKYLIKPFEQARELKKSFFQDGILIGYFPSQHEKISLLYLDLTQIEAITSIDAKLLEIFTGNVGPIFDNLLLNQEITETQEELIYRLGDVVESRSNEASNHVRRMSEICHMLALAIGMSQEEAELIRQASPMHDIGKIATPDAVLLKPGKLLDDEMEIMKKHPALGYAILQGSKRPILKAAAVIAQQHHEKYDGTGYPNAMVGQKIHAYARIAAVADVFDALSHKRCYKKSWPLDEVLIFIQKASGSHLDPIIVDALLANIDQAIAINDKFKDIT